MTPEQRRVGLEMLLDLGLDDMTGVHLLEEATLDALGRPQGREALKAAMKELLRAVWDDGTLAVVYGASEWHRFKSWGELEAAFDSEWERQAGELEPGTLLWLMDPADVPSRPKAAGEPRLYHDPVPPDYSTDEGDYWLVDTPIGPRIIGPSKRK